MAISRFSLSISRSAAALSALTEPSVSPSSSSWDVAMAAILASQGLAGQADVITAKGNYDASEAKAAIFGLLAGLTACYLGLNAKGGDDGWFTDAQALYLMAAGGALVLAGLALAASINGSYVSDVTIAGGVITASYESTAPQKARTCGAMKSTGHPNASAPSSGAADELDGSGEGSGSWSPASPWSSRSPSSPPSRPWSGSRSTSRDGSRRPRPWWRSC